MSDSALKSGLGGAYGGNPYAQLQYQQQQMLQNYMQVVQCGAGMVTMQQPVMPYEPLPNKLLLLVEEGDV